MFNGLQYVQPVVTEISIFDLTREELDAALKDGAYQNMFAQAYNMENIERYLGQKERQCGQRSTGSLFTRYNEKQKWYHEILKPAHDAWHDARRKDRQSENCRALLGELLAVLRAGAEQFKTLALDDVTKFSALLTAMYMHLKFPDFARSREMEDMPATAAAL